MSKLLLLCSILASISVYSMMGQDEEDLGQNDTYYEQLEEYRNKHAKKFKLLKSQQDNTINEVKNATKKVNVTNEHFNNKKENKIKNHDKIKLTNNNILCFFIINYSEIFICRIMPHLNKSDVINLLASFEALTKLIDKIQSFDVIDVIKIGAVGKEQEQYIPLIAYLNEAKKYNIKKYSSADAMLVFLWACEHDDDILRNAFFKDEPFSSLAKYLDAHGYTNKAFFDWLDDQPSMFKGLFFSCLGDHDFVHITKGVLNNTESKLFKYIITCPKLSTNGIIKSKTPFHWYLLKIFVRALKNDNNELIHPSDKSE